MRVGIVPLKRGAAWVLLGATALVGLGVSSAEAQIAANCTDIQPMLLQRKSIAASLSGGKQKQIDAKVACSRFGALVANGASLVKWTEANKDWCQVPDSFLAGIKQDHERAIAIRAKACGIAAKQVQMEKQAKQGGGGGLLGGGGLSGDMRIPQGAL